MLKSLWITWGYTVGVLLLAMDCTAKTFTLLLQRPSRIHTLSTTFFTRGTVKGEAL